MFHTICMHEFGWLSEKGVNLNLLLKEEVPRKGGGVPSEKGGSNPGANCEVSQSLGWMLKSPKKNTFADGLIERTSSILDGIE